jgi:hypothetical protein
MIARYLSPVETDILAELFLRSGSAVEIWLSGTQVHGSLYGHDKANREVRPQPQALYVREWDIAEEVQK